MAGAELQLQGRKQVQGRKGVPIGPREGDVRPRHAGASVPVRAASARRTFTRGVGEPSALRVLVVARAWCWREAMLRVLEHDDVFAPVAAVGAEATGRAARESFDVAVVDLDDRDGASTLEALRDLRLACLAVGAGRGQSEIAEALNVAASYAVKSELEPDRLRQFVRIAASGDALFVQANRRALARLVAGGDAAQRYRLTPRELEVLTHVAAGRTNAEIARALHLAPSSVKKVVSRCLVRLGVRNRVEAALLARREGLVRDGVV